MVSGLVNIEGQSTVMTITGDIATTLSHFYQLT